MKANHSEGANLRTLDAEEIALVHGGHGLVKVLEKVVRGDEFFRVSAAIDEIWGEWPERTQGPI